jgi:hypothetical protein
MIAAIESIALRAMTSKPWGAQRGQAQQPRARCQPTGLGMGGVGYEGAERPRLGSQSAVGGDPRQPVGDVPVVDTQGVAVADDRTPLTLVPYSAR